MCTGVEAAIIIAGTMVSAAGAIQSGQAAQRQANLQAEALNQQAQREQQIAAQNEEDYRRQQSRLVASRRAMMGANGVMAGTGTPLLVAEDMAGEIELQALRIRNGGDAKALGLQTEASLQRMKGSAERTNSYYRAGGTLLKGAGEAYKTR
jgi:hypothetical protein